MQAVQPFFWLVFQLLRGGSVQVLPYLVLYVYKHHINECDYS